MKAWNCNKRKVLKNKKNNEKIGLAVLTFNRKEFFKKCINSIPVLDEVLVINDGKPYESNIYPKHVTKIIQHKKNKGIAYSKNEALKYLLSKTCTHLFLCEDDIALKSKKIINKYILASKLSGIYHFNYGFHGTWNRDKKGKPTPRLLIDYGKDISIAFNRELTGAFSYYRDEVINSVGFMDEFYVNVLEHVDYTFRIIKKGYHPSLYWFADIKNSFEYILELDPELKESTNMKWNSFYNFRIKFFTFYFILKHGKKPHKFIDADLKSLHKELEIMKKDRAIL